MADENDEKSAKTEDILGALILSDELLMHDLFYQCETELTERVDVSNAAEILDRVEDVQRAERIKVKKYALASIKSRQSDNHLWLKLCCSIQNH